MFIIDICTHEVVSISARSTVREAAERMRHFHVGMLVVVEQPNGERFPIGVITDRDIVVSVIAPGVDPEIITVGDVMTASVHSCGANDDLFNALQTMRSAGVRRLPVLDAGGELRGLVSVDDIVGTLGRHLSDLAATLQREQINEMRQRV